MDPNTRAGNLTATILVILSLEQVHISKFQSCAFIGFTLLEAFMETRLKILRRTKAVSFSFFKNLSMQTFIPKLTCRFTLAKDSMKILAPLLPN